MSKKSDSEDNFKVDAKVNPDNPNQLDVDITIKPPSAIDHITTDLTKEFNKILSKNIGGTLSPPPPPTPDFSEMLATMQRIIESTTEGEKLYNELGREKFFIWLVDNPELAQFIKDAKSGKNKAYNTLFNKNLKEKIDKDETSKNNNSK